MRKTVLLTVEKLGLSGENVLQSDQVLLIDSATYMCDNQDQFANDAMMIGTSLIPRPCPSAAILFAGSQGLETTGPRIAKGLV